MLHSFIDGLAIGVFDEIGAITILAVSVIIHRIPVACSVGTTFKTNNQEAKAPCSVIVFWLFILASPIGMLCGMLLNEVETGLGLVIIQAMSGGTFVYLACCDLLVHEFHSDHDAEEIKYESIGGEKKAVKEMRMLPFYKFACVLLGSAIVVTLVAIAPAHEH